MRHRTLTTALLVSILMLASAGPANALFDIGGVIQRAQMIVNQATQIANQIRQMRTMTRQLTELEEQLDYMKDVARGEVDALIEPFAELRPDPSASSATASTGAPSSPARPASWSTRCGTWGAAARSPTSGGARRAWPTR